MKTKNTISRRHFLRASATLAAAPFILPSCVWAAETNPSDRVTLGFIGFGRQAHGLMSGFLSQPETQVVAACDVDETRRKDGKKVADDFYAKKAGSDYKGCEIYKD